MKDGRPAVTGIEWQLPGRRVLIEEPFSTEISEGAGHRKGAVNVEAADYIPVVTQELNGQVSSDAADAVPQECVRSLAGL